MSTELIVNPPDDRCMTPWSPDLPIASLDRWPDDDVHQRRSTLEVYLVDLGAIHAEARRQERVYGSVLWDSIREILDWECEHGRVSDSADAA